MKNPVTMLSVANSGHGHVFPRPDGAKARCGGPPLCHQCALDQARKDAGTQKPEASPAPAEAETFTTAERLGLAVAATVKAVESQRDQAMDALREALKEWPQTSWAHDSLAYDNAVQALAELEDQVAHPQGATLNAHDQGDASAPRQDHPDADPRG